MDLFVAVPPTRGCASDGCSLLLCYGFISTGRLWIWNCTLSYICLDNAYERIPPGDPHEHLELSQWATVLIHEAYDKVKYYKGESQDLSFPAIKRLRYALITPFTKSNSLDREFIVADIPTDVEHLIGETQDKGQY